MSAALSLDCVACYSASVVARRARQIHEDDFYPGVTQMAGDPRTHGAHANHRDFVDLVHFALSQAGVILTNRARATAAPSRIRRPFD
jgi:hypothetical protein